MASNRPKVEDLHLVNLTKSFGDFKAVDNLSLTIPAGSFFALLGPSGCGKTTTLRMVAGLEEPTSGQIKLGQEDVTNLPPYKRWVNTVFQSYALFPHLTIYENVAFGLRRQKAKDIDNQVKAMLELVELTTQAQKKPQQLSGGQQQRVAVARALINEPDVLLLDEPLGALDLKLRRQMQLELKRIQTEVGITFVHVTHDQEEAMTMADTIAVMDALHIEKAHYMGLSLGGMSGVGLGIQHANRLISMVLCDCRADMPSPMGDVWNDRMTSAINEGCQSLAVATTERWFGLPFMEAHPVVGQAFRQTIASTTASGFVSCARAIQGLNYLEEVSHIKVPTTLIVGAKDGPLPQAMLEMQQRIEGAKMEIIPDAGHLPNIDQSVLFNAAMMRHFFQNPAWSQA